MLYPRFPENKSSSIDTFTFLFEVYIYSPASWDHSEYESEGLLPIITPLMLDRIEWEIVGIEKPEEYLLSPGRGVDLGIAIPLNMYTGISSSLKLCLVKEKGSVSLLNGKAAIV